ncbi:MAG: serine protease, partial [Chthonomonadales bacterium]
MKITSVMLAAIGMLVAIPAVRADDEAMQVQALMDKTAPAIVTVKSILKSAAKGDGQGQDSESPIAMQGVVVSADGLVMLTNLAFAPARAMELVGRGGGAEAGAMKVNPTNIKVMFAGDDKEYDAFLAATDTTLDLAFVKIEGLGDKKLAFVDFTVSGMATVGQRVLSIARLQKGFDYAPFYQSGRICGMISKPRKALMLEGSIASFGLPIFAITGEPIGVLSTVVAGSSDDASAAGASFNTFLRY